MQAVLASSFFRAASVYGVLNILRQLVPFLLLPVLTNYLSPEDYGALATFNIVIALLYIVVGLNLDGAVGREFFERDKIDFPKYVANCIGISLFIAVLCVPILYILSPWLEKITGLDAGFLWAALVISYLRYVTQVLLVIWQSGMRAFSYAILQISQIILEVALAISFIVVLEMGLLGRIDAIFFTSVVFAFISVFILVRQGLVRGGYNQEYIKEALAFGVPLIPHAIGGLAIAMTDRILLMNMVGAEQTGLYFVGFQVGSVIALSAYAFNQAWSPWLFGKLNNITDAAKKRIVLLTYGYCVCILVGAFLLTAIAPIIFEYFVGDQFSDGLRVVGWVALGSSFMGMYYVVGAYITYVRKTHILSWVTLFVGVANLVFSYVLIQHNGYVGAAQGTALAYFLSFVLTFILSAKVYPMPWIRKFA